MQTHRNAGPHCTIYHGAWRWWVVTTVHLCQGTGMTVLIGNPATWCFPAYQRLPSTTNPLLSLATFSCQPPLQGLLTLLAPKPRSPSPTTSLDLSQTILFPSSSQMGSALTAFSSTPVSLEFLTNEFRPSIKTAFLRVTCITYKANSLLWPFPLILLPH